MWFSCDVRLGNGNGSFLIMGALVRCHAQRTSHDQGKAIGHGRSTAAGVADVILGAEVT
jgi:hypothetical protein